MQKMPPYREYNSVMKEVRLDLITPWGRFELHEQEYNMTMRIINDMIRWSGTIFNPTFKMTSQNLVYGCTVYETLEGLSILDD